MARAETPMQFAASLLAASAKASAGAQAVVGKGANNIKTEARASVAKSAPVHNGHAQYAITYDEPHLSGSFRFESEIGYDKDIAGGALGNLLEYGGGGDRSPAHRDLGRALDDEAPKFEAALQAMALKLL